MWNPNCYRVKELLAKCQWLAESHHTQCTMPEIASCLTLKLIWCRSYHAKSDWYCHSGKYCRITLLPIVNYHSCSLVSTLYNQSRWLMNWQGSLDSWFSAMYYGRSSTAEQVILSYTWEACGWLDQYIHESTHLKFALTEWQLWYNRLIHCCQWAAGPNIVAKQYPTW